MKSYSKARRFAVNILILTLTSLLLRTVNVSFGVYLSGKIGAEGMGVYQLLSSVYMLAITLAASGVSLASTRMVLEELNADSSAPKSLRAGTKNIKKVITRCILYSLIMSVVSASLLVTLAGVIAKHWLHGKISVYPIYALAASLPFISVSSAIGGYFSAVMRMAKSASAQILGQFVAIGFTIMILGFFMPAGLDNAILGIAVGGAAAEIIACLYLYVLYVIDRRRYRETGKPGEAKNVTVRILGIALPVAVSSVIRSALNAYKQIIIPVGLGKSGGGREQALAQYGLIRGMVMPVLMFPSALLASFGALLVPEIAENYIKKNHTYISETISKIFKITLLFSIAVGGVFWGFSKELSYAVYKNLDVAAYLAVFAPLIIIMYLDDIVDAVLKGLNEQVRVVGINILDTIVCILLLTTLLPIMNIKGYILVIFVSELLNGGLSILRLRRVTKFYLDIFCWLIIPAVTMAVCVLIAKPLFPNFIVGICISITLYAIALGLLGIIGFRIQNAKLKAQN